MGCTAALAWSCPSLGAAGDSRPSVVGAGGVQAGMKKRMEKIQKRKCVRWHNGGGEKTSGERAGDLSDREKITL